jgi:uncharacterized lipoprotein
MGKASIAAAVLLLVAGCATRPAAAPLDDVREFGRGYDAVWDNLVQHLAGTDFRIKSTDRASGVIYAERSSFDDALADCGTRGLASTSGRSVGFNVFVTEADGATRVQVNADFSESRYLERSRWETECQSTGVLEASILDALEA